LSVAGAVSLIVFCWLMVATPATGIPYMVDTAVLLWCPRYRQRGSRFRDDGPSRVWGAAAAHRAARFHAAGRSPLRRDGGVTHLLSRAAQTPFCTSLGPPII